MYKKEGTLWITIHGEPDLKLLPESNTKFFSSNKEYDWQVEFETDGNGNVENIHYIQRVEERSKEIVAKER